MLLMSFVQRPSDHFADRLQRVHRGDVSDAAAVSTYAASPEAGYFPVMMCAEVGAVFTGWHHSFYSRQTSHLPEQQYFPISSQRSSPVSILK